MTTVGIIGCGFVGGALKNWLDENNKDVKVVVNAPPKGMNNDTHAFVPGPDGKFGYGGKCFPKDVNAFAKMTEGTPLGTLLAPLHGLNVGFRGYEEHI